MSTPSYEGLLSDFLEIARENIDWESPKRRVMTIDEPKRPKQNLRVLKLYFLKLFILWCDEDKMEIP